MVNVSLKAIRKLYGTMEVIHGIDIDIAGGELIVIVGPSGCGKSTLLRMVAGLETVSSGEISIDDRVVNRFEPRQRNIAMVFQNYALYPHMSVFDNMAYGLKLAKVSKEQIHQRVTQTAKMLQLQELLHRKPRQLSGGQRQRVAMGRAVVRKPAVFLFDEPLSNLDAKLRVDMRTEIKQLHQKLKATIVYVTHDQIEAMTLADRIAVMEGGIVRQLGTPDDIYNHPDNLFVASFMGSPSMNLIEVVIEKKSGENIAMIEACGKRVGLPTGRSDLTEGALIMGIRPESILETAPAETKEFARLTNIVEVVEPSGSYTFVISTIVGVAVNARMRGDLRVRAGEPMPFYFDMSRAHFFAPDSGQRYAP